MVCPVVVQANDMGILACSEFAAPARMPAALAPSGNDDAAKPAYAFGTAAPPRRSSGSKALMYPPTEVPGDLTPTRSGNTQEQGLTLVHFSAQLKRILSVRGAFRHC